MFHAKSFDSEGKLFYDQRWSKIPEHKKYLPLEEGLDLVKKGGYAFHVIPFDAYPYIEKKFSNKEVCELTEIHLTRLHFEAIGVSKNCSFLEMFISHSTI